MREGIPRPLLALTAVVVVAAICLGVRDYVQKKQASPTASTSTAVQPNAIGLPKKATSAKTRRVRISATEANMLATESAKNDIAPDTVSAEGVHGEAEVTTERNNRVGDERDKKDKKIARPASSTPRCLPLPNLTKLTDADALYYENWAREYECVF